MPLYFHMEQSAHFTPSASGRVSQKSSSNHIMVFIQDMVQGLQLH